MKISEYIGVKRLLTSALLLSILIAPMLTVADVKIGVIAPRGVFKTMKRWEEYGNYLEKELGDKVTIIPMTPARLLPSAKNGLFNFALTHPAHTVALVENQDAILLSTLKTKVGSEFAGVILARKDSGIVKAEDLRGKSVMSLKFKAAAGAYIFQAYHLKLKGVDVHKDFKSFKEGIKQDAIIMALNAGKIDAVFVRSGMLEALDREGKIDKNDFVVVDAHAKDDIPNAHTTSHYPEWYLSAIPNKTDKKTINRVKELTLKLKPGNKALTTANIEGFVEPVSLDGMRSALKSLKISPYDKP